MTLWKLWTLFTLDTLDILTLWTQGALWTFWSVAVDLYSALRDFLFLNGGSPRQ